MAITMQGQERFQACCKKQTRPASESEARVKVSRRGHNDLFPLDASMNSPRVS
jgi:hypothetical protein